MHVMNTDALSYQSKIPEKCLETAESEKKRKYINDCLHEYRYLTPFVASVDDLIRVKANVTLKCIISRPRKS